MQIVNKSVQKKKKIQKKLQIADSVIIFIMSLGMMAPQIPKYDGFIFMAIRGIKGLFSPERPYWCESQESHTSEKKKTESFSICLVWRYSSLTEKCWPILEMSSEKRRYFSSIMRLINVNFGPFRHRSKTTLKKWLKKMVWDGWYSMGWLHLIPPLSFSLSPWIRILIMAYI